MPTKPVKHNISLRPATRSDIPSLTAISGASFQNDTHTQLKALAQDPPLTAAEYMSHGTEQHFLSWFDKTSTTTTTTTTLTVATIPNHTEGEDQDLVVGYLMVGSRGLQHDRQSRPTASYGAVVRNRGPPPSSSSLPNASGTVKDLAKITDTSMRNWQDWFLTPPLPVAGAGAGAEEVEEAQCYYIISMSVHPNHQARGVGSALMRELTGKCEERNVPCWVQSGESGVGFYEKWGFVEVGRLEVELDGFNVAEYGRRVERSDGRRWGRYCWRYMERSPGRKG